MMYHREPQAFIPISDNTSPNPKYRRQKGHVRDRAFVVLDGKHHYLGTYGSPESKQLCHRLVAEWWANGGRLLFEGAVRASKPLPSFEGTDAYQVVVTLDGQVRDRGTSKTPVELPDG